MDFTELLDIEDNLKATYEIIIPEKNVKERNVNKIFKVGGHYSYSHPDLQGRFLTWTVKNNCIYFKETSIKYDILSPKLEIAFEKSKVIAISVYETTNSIVFLIAGSLSVVRFSLHHPTTLRRPANETCCQYSIFYGIGELDENQSFITPFIDISAISAANAVLDQNNGCAYFNYGLSNGNVYTFEFPETSDNKFITGHLMSEGYLLSKFLSGFIPSFGRSNDYNDFSILEMTYVYLESEIFLATISRDNKLKIWNLQSKSAMIVEDLLPFVLNSNDNFKDRTAATINYTSLISNHRIKSFYKDLSIKDSFLSENLVVYFQSRLGKKKVVNWMVFKILGKNERTEDNKAIQIFFNETDEIDNELIDFSVSYDMNADKNAVLGLWRLYQTITGQYRLDWRPLTQKFSTHYQSARLYEPCNDWEYVTDPQFNDDKMDVQECVMDAVFKPGFATIRAILDVINKEKQAEYILNLESVNINRLKKELVILVESKIEKEVEMYSDQFSDTDSIDIIGIRRKCWENTLKEILAEHNECIEPLFFFSISDGSYKISTFGLIRGASNYNISLLRKHNRLEYIINCKSPISDPILRQYYGEHAGSGSVFMNYLYSCIEWYQTRGLLVRVVDSLFVSGQSPAEFMEIYGDDMYPPLEPGLQTRLENAPDTLYLTVELLEQLELIDYEFDSNQEATNYNMSTFSTSLMHYNIRQMISDRIIMSMALLALLKPRSINSSIGTQIKSLMKRIEVIIKSLVSMHWLLNLRQMPNKNLSDLNVQLCSKLNLLQNKGSGTSALYGIDLISLKVIKSLQQNMRVFQLNKSNKRAKYSRIADNSLLMWLDKFREDTAALLMYLNPISDSFALLEIIKYFITYNLPMELIEYLKFLLKSDPNCWWCSNRDESLVTFFLGYSYLLLNKPYKAIQYWIECLCNYQSNLDPDMTSSLLTVIYSHEDIVNEPEEDDIGIYYRTRLIMKMVDILEDARIEIAHIVKLLNCGIEACEDIRDASKRHVNESLLLSKLFNNYLELERYQDAMTALVRNQDEDKQNVCLRLLVTTLCNADRFDLLVEFDYDMLYNEFVSIIASRARLSDIANNKTRRYYDLLFSIHLKRTENLEMAAQSMLELALRLAVDLSNQMELQRLIDSKYVIASIQRQLGAYLSCMSVCELIISEANDKTVNGNCLFLLPANIGRILSGDEHNDFNDLKQKNVPSNQPEKMETNLSMSMGDTIKKSDLEDDVEDVEDKEDDKKDNKSRVIISFKQIRRQFFLLRCQMCIISNSDYFSENCGHNIDLIGSNIIRILNMLPTVIRSTLLDMSLYKEAIQLTNELDLDIVTVLDAVVMKYIRLYCHYSKCNRRVELREKENISDALEDLNTTSAYSSISCTQKLFWLLIQEILIKFDKSPNGDLCIRVCHKFLTNSTPVELGSFHNKQKAVILDTSNATSILPSWLIKWIVKEKQASGELIRVYLSCGHIEAAAEIAIDWLVTRLDNVSQFNEYLLFSGQLEDNKQVDFNSPIWINFSVIFYLIDVLDNVVETTNNQRAKNLLESLHSKIALIGSFNN